MSLLNLLRKRAPNPINMKALHKLFDALILNANPFQIQSAPNCRYTPKKLMHILAYASLEQNAIESTCTLFRANGDFPCPSATRNALSRHPPPKIDALVNDYLFKTLKKLKRFSSPSKGKASTVIIDFHDDHYYGKDNSLYIVSGKRKKSTKKFFVYATISLLENSASYTLGMRSVDNTTTRFEIMKDLIEQAKKLVNVQTVLVDASFYTVNAAHYLDQEEISGIIRGIRNKSVKRLFERFKGYLENEGSYKRIPYIMRSHDNKKRYQVNLILYRQQGKLSVLMVNKKCHLKAIECIKLYKKRSSIETSYRMKHFVKAWTSSNKPGLRAVLFGMSCLLYSLWVIYREVVAKFKQEHKYEGKAKKISYETRMWILLTFIRLKIAPLLSQEGSLM